MKKIVILFIMLSSVLFGGVNWSKSYKMALSEAKMANKPLMFIVSKRDCRFCIKLNDVTLQDKAIVDELNKDFISSRSYFDEGDFVPQELFTPGVPAIWFLLADGTPMFKPLMGYIAPDEFSKALEIVKQEYKNMKEAK